jgi:S-layer homology domain
MTNSFPELPNPPESNSDENAETTVPPRSRRPILDSDEKIAVLIAFTTIGAILWWSLGGIKNAFNFNNWQSLFAPSTLQANAKQQIPSQPEVAANVPTSEAESQSLQAITPEVAETQPQVRSAREKAKKDLEVPPVIFPVIVPQPTIPSTPQAPSAVQPTPTTPQTPSAVQPTPSTPQAPSAVQPTPTKPQPSETTETPSVPTVAFQDVPKEYWAYPFIEKLSSKKLIAGVTEDNFEPDRPITRAQMASLLDTAFDSQPQQNKTASFKDVPSKDPAAKDIQKAIQKGFMRGYSKDSFRPQENISRYQVLVTLATGLNLKPTREPKQILNNYQDADRLPAWAANQVAAAAEKGLIVNQSNPNLLDPEKPATRAETAVMIYQALSNLGQIEKKSSEYIMPIN